MSEINSTVKVTLIPAIVTVPPPDRVVVEMDRADAVALVAAGYGCSGPTKQPTVFGNDDYDIVGHLDITVYCEGKHNHKVVYPRPAADLRERLRRIGSAINKALQP